MILYDHSENSYPFGNKLRRLSIAGIPFPSLTISSTYSRDYINLYLPLRLLQSSYSFIQLSHHPYPFHYRSFRYHLLSCLPFPLQPSSLLEGLRASSDP